MRMVLLVMLCRFMIGMNLAATILVAALFAPFCAHAAARIRCPAPVFDFGVTNSSARIVHAFELENAGDEPLQVVSVKCCCSAKCSEPAKILQPGQKTSFTIDLSLANRSGVLTKRLYVRSSDPGCVILPLTVTGRVTGGAGQPEVSGTPERSRQTEPRGGQCGGATPTGEAR